VPTGKKFSVYTDRTLVLLFIVSFAVSLGMNSIISIWPLFIVSLGATVLEAGYVISLSGIVGTILTGSSGIISDRIGRKRIVLASIILATVSPLLYMLAGSWRELILWGTLYGSVFALFMPTRNAWIADLVEPEKRAAAYSFLFLALPIGSVAGPTIGGIIVDSLGWKYLFMLVAAIHGLSLLPMIAIRDGGKPPAKQEKPSEETLHSGGQTRVLALLILLWFILGLGFGIMGPMIPLYLTERFKTTTTQIGIFSSIGFGVAGSLAQIFTPRLAGKLGNGKLLLYCCSIVPFTFFLWPSRTSYGELLVLYMIAMVANTITWSPALSILMEAAPASRRGLFSGLFEASITLGFIVGPTLGGMLWEVLGPNAPIYASSIVLITSIPTALLVNRSQRTPQHFEDEMIQIEKNRLDRLLSENDRLINSCRQLIQANKDLGSKISVLEERLRAHCH